MKRQSGAPKRGDDCDVAQQGELGNPRHLHHPWIGSQSSENDKQDSKISAVPNSWPDLYQSPPSYLKFLFYNYTPSTPFVASRK